MNSVTAINHMVVANCCFIQRSDRAFIGHEVLTIFKECSESSLLHNQDDLVNDICSFFFSENKTRIRSVLGNLSDEFEFTDILCSCFTLRILTSEGRKSKNWTLEVELQRNVNLIFSKNIKDLFYAIRLERQQ